MVAANFFLLALVNLSHFLRSVNGCLLPGWIPFGNNCYGVYSETVPRATAAARCHSQGGNLAEILNTETLSFLNSEIAKRQHSNGSLYWVGLQLHNGLLTWNNKYPAVTDWTVQENNFPCFALSRLRVVSHECSRAQGYICELPNSSSSSSVPDCARNASWSVFGEPCFWVFPQRVPMFGKHGQLDAFQACGLNSGVPLTFNELNSGSFHTDSLPASEEGELYWLDLYFDGEDVVDSANEKVDMTFAELSVSGHGSCIAAEFDNRSARKIKLHQAECLSYANVICQRNKDKFSSGSTPPNPNRKLTRKVSKRFSLECPHGYNWKEDEKSGYCYWETSYETSRLSWKEARRHCQSYGGDLASFHSQQEEKIGLSFQYGSLIHPYWIGLVYNAENDTYEWTDGSPLDYTNWASGQPDHRNNRMRCVQMHASEKHWIVSYCGSLSWFVCKAPKQINPRIPVIPSRTPFISCEGSSSEYFFNGYCYSVPANIQFNWVRASVYCQNNNANLVSVHSEDEVDFLIRLLYESRSVESKRVWIGLSSMSLDSQFQWSDRTDLDFINWDQDEPNNVQNQEKCCNMYVNNGLWNDDYCMNTLNFVCKRKNNTDGEEELKTTVSPVVGNCRNDWIPFGDSCYLLGGTKNSNWTSWKNASNACEDLGGNLASVHSKKQQTFLSFLLQSLKSDAWIGLHDTLQVGVYLWSDRTRIDYTNWAQGEPSYIGFSEDCIAMTYDDPHSGIWKSEPCNRTLPYICEAPKDPSIAVAQPSRKTQCLHPPEWLKMGSSCFKLFEDKLSWASAREACQLQHADLVSVSDFTVQAVVKYLSTQVNESVWIGLLSNPKNELRWLNNWPISLTEWDSNQPALRMAEPFCFASSPEGYWRAVPCRERRPFICQVTGESPPPQKTYKKEISCPRGYYDAGGDYCYYFETGLSTLWSAANFHCFQRGATLASFHSMKEIEELNSLKLDKSFFTGLVRNAKGGFSWTDGSPVNFVNWVTLSPDNETEKCVAASGDKLEWEVVSCRTRRYFVCGKDKASLETKMIADNVSSEYLATEKGYTGLSTAALTGIIMSILVVLVAAAILLFIYWRKDKFPFAALFSSSSEPPEHVTSFENALYSPNSALEMLNRKDSEDADE